MKPEIFSNAKGNYAEQDFIMRLIKSDGLM